MYALETYIILGSLLSYKTEEQNHSSEIHKQIFISSRKISIFPLATESSPTSTSSLQLPHSVIHSLLDNTVKFTSPYTREKKKEKEKKHQPLSFSKNYLHLVSHEKLTYIILNKRIFSSFLLVSIKDILFHSIYFRLMYNAGPLSPDCRRIASTNQRNQPCLQSGRFARDKQAPW